MSITGYLAEFSLPEIFQFVQQGNKTGRLTIGNSSVPLMPNDDMNYFWFKDGDVVAASKTLNDKGLISLISQKNWVTQANLTKLADLSHRTPLGLNLKSAGLLQVEQLNLLYQTQIVICLSELLESKQVWFSFRDIDDIPYVEMTGINRSAGDILLTALRNVQDLSLFQEKLPDPYLGLIKLPQKSGNEAISLKRSEEKILELSDASMSLQKMAKQLNLPEEKVIHIAFRLMMAGIVEEAGVKQISRPVTKVEKPVTKVEKPATKVVATNNKPYNFDIIKTPLLEKVFGENNEKTVEKTVSNNKQEKLTNKTELTDNNTSDKKPVANSSLGNLKPSFVTSTSTHNREKNNLVSVTSGSLSKKLETGDLDDSQPTKPVSNNFLKSLVSFLNKH